MPTNALVVTALTVKLVLPAFSDFAEKAELDLPLPITEARITKSFVNKTRPAVSVTVDGRHYFSWHSRVDDKRVGMKVDLMKGRISYSDNSNRLATMPGKLAKKQSLVTTNEAREIALSFLKRAGYDLSKADIEVGPPEVTQATYLSDPRGSLMPMPGYRIGFTKKGMEKRDRPLSLMEIEVSGLTKKITRFSSSPWAFKAVSVDLGKYPPL